MTKNDKDDSQGILEAFLWYTKCEGLALCAIGNGFSVGMVPV
jgi:hypothetical protein